MNDKIIGEFTLLARDLISQAQSDRDAQVRRLTEAGASPLMVDALLDVARKEMWAVLFSHLVEVAVAQEQQQHEFVIENGDYAAGLRYGIEMCIRNVFEYVQVKPAGNA
jgi:hypothetical protein